MAFTSIRKIISNMSKINTGLVLKELVENQGIDQLIIRLITEGEPTSQLFNLNVDGDGVKLSDIGGDYAPLTLFLADIEGRPKKDASSINLKDTGKFYDSGKIRVEGNKIIIEFDTQKDTSDLLDDWGEKIVDITEENLQIVINEIERLLPALLEKLLLSSVA